MAAPGAVRATGYSLSPARYLSAWPADSPSSAGLEPERILAGLAAEIGAATRLGAQVAAMTAASPTGPRAGSPGRPGQLPLERVCDIRPGPSQSRIRDASAQGEVPVVMPRHLRGGWIDANGAIAVSEETARDVGDRFRIAAGDILMSRTGTIRPPAVAGTANAGWLLSQNLLRLRVTSLEEVDPGYLAAFLGPPRVQDWIRVQARGTTVPSLSAQVLGALPVTIPPLRAQREAAAALAAITALIQAHRDVADSAQQALALLGDGLVNGTLQVTGPDPAITETAAAPLTALSYPGRPTAAPPGLAEAEHSPIRHSQGEPRGHGKTLRGGAA